jgi:uncharacterized membrane protein YuzA (DUF378 family)
METLKRFEPFALLVMFLGALNWGILGITDGETNVLAEIFGTGTLTDVVYVVIGLAAVVLAPRLMDAFHLSGGAHPRGV